MDVRFSRRLFSLLTAAGLLLSLPGYCAAAEVIDDGVRPVYDEAYYATTDYYGNLTNGSVVKSYILNGASELTDYGTYDEVVNLSDGRDPVRNGQAVTFQFGPDAPARFYFEGKTASPFAALPWTMEVRYRLNGVAARAEELAGKTGVVEINIDASPNPSASEYARNNYILAASALFNQDDILSLEAPGSQLQLIGNLRTVLFLAFPGEEQHFSIRVGTEAFSFAGLTFMMMPATLSQLEEVAKISERKEDLEDSYHDLSDSLDTLLDAFDGMQESLYQTAGGLDTLNGARQTISSGKGNVYAGVDAVRSDLEGLTGALDPVSRQAKDASAFVTESRGAVNELVDATVQLSGNLGDLEGILTETEERLAAMEKGLEAVETGLAETVTGLEDVESGLSYTGESLLTVEDSLSWTEEDLEEMEGGLYRTERSLGDVEGNLESLEKSLRELEENADGIRDLLEQAEDLEGSLNNLSLALDDAKLPRTSTGSRTSSEDTIASVLQVGQLYALTEGGSTPNEAAFYGVMLERQGYDSATAGQLSALFASHNEEAIAANDPDGSLTAGYRQLSALYQAGDYETFAAAILRTQGYSASDADKTARQMSQIWTIYQSGGGDRAALELLLDSLDSVSGTVSNISGSANTALRDVAVPAADVAGEIAELVRDLDALIDTVDDARSLSGTLRETTGTLRDASAALRETLGDVTAVSGDLRDVLGDLRNASGDLQGLLDALTGASSALRGTLTALSETSAALRDLSGTARSGAGKLREASGTVRGILGEVDDLREVANRYEPTLQEALHTLDNLSSSASRAVRDTNSLLSTAESLAKSAGGQLDAGTRESLTGLSTAVRKAADGLDSTEDLRSAKDTITDLIEDTWDEYTGEKNNLLLMDAAAEAQSLTSGRNPAPQSVQIIIRTQEIEEEDDDADTGGQAAQTSESPGFLSRIGQMFRDFWNSLTGIFHREKAGAA